MRELQESRLKRPCCPDNLFRNVSIVTVDSSNGKESNHLQLLMSKPQVNKDDDPQRRHGRPEEGHEPELINRIDLENRLPGDILLKHFASGDKVA